LTGKTYIKIAPDEHCRLCGHACLAKRSAGDTGLCGAGTLVGFSAALQHYGEEPPISGDGDGGGSGTIFFTRCVLRCVFCQNWQISQTESGHDISVEQLADTMLELEAKGALNINLVSPTPYAVQIVMALSRAKKEGLSLPIVYNTGGYDSLTTLGLMDGLVDIYLPDAKMAPATGSDINEPDSQSARLLGAGDYPKINQIALKEMYRQVGPLRLDGQGIAQRGMLARHLVLPDNLARTTEMLPWLSDTFGPTIHLSLMAQYHPTHLVKTNPEEFRAYPGLSRHLSIREYDEALELAEACGLENTFIQELDSANHYLPDFSKSKVFSH
jgi:putative pyruvate formate lyase activating enzyme